MKNTGEVILMVKCELDESKICNDCGQCQICDLNKNKTCDNCCECIGLDSQYKVIEVENIEDGVEYDFSEDEEKIYMDWVNMKGNQSIH